MQNRRTIPRSPARAAAPLLLLAAATLLALARPARAGLDERGWTILKPAADARVVYVSFTLGDDSQDGLAERRPVRSLKRGLSLLRDGRGDWLLLRRGDIWADQSFDDWELSGKSADEPLVLGAYGEGDRPTLLTGRGCGFRKIAPRPVRHVALVGLRFHAHTRDPDHPLYSGPAGETGIRWLGPGEDLLIEDCLVQGYASNITIEGGDNGKAPLHDFRLRRSMIIDAYSNTSHSQGLYASMVDGILVEECLFDHNGWNDRVPEAGATHFNHHVYLDNENVSDRIEVRGNIFARASSHAVQARRGGVVRDNLVVRCPLGILLGGGDDFAKHNPDGIDGTVANNVILDGTDINDKEPRGFGIDLANIRSAKVEGNLIAHDRTARPFGHGISLDTPAAAVLLRGNIVYDWRIALRSGAGGPRIAIEGNDFEALDRDCPLMVWTVSPEGTVFRGNRYASPRPTAKWFTILERPSGFEGLPADAAPPGAGPGPRPDPTRGVAEYQASLGGRASLEAFLAQARAQSRQTWREAYLAETVCAFIRAGYLPARK
ncbi:MAG: right-handed parallel beta-helix repeat-containing protein [Planctomycetota bacterium]|nr:right-handed parallel beta-helix repeat-containing protein [Planctomycetota bacterium]